MIVGVGLLLVSLALRAASANRLVRSRLLTSCVLFATYAIAAALAAYGPLPPEVAQEIRTFNPLLLTFGLAILIVVVTINPWREDRLPDRFPTIVQDVMVIALFAIVATLFMQEKVLATTAVGAVVIGFALQDTLGNLFSGLAIQIEKPFRVGHWVTIAGTEGLVSEVTWRATKIRTKAGNFVVVPNSVVAKETITNYSEPTQETMLEVEVGASYDTPPNEVKAALLRALRDEPMLIRGREPEILIHDFGASAVTYRVRVWTTDFAGDVRVRIPPPRDQHSVPDPGADRSEPRGGRRQGARATAGWRRDLRGADRRTARAAGGRVTGAAVRGRTGHRAPG
jgi:small-conductance mechanosensitive channel